MTLSTNALAVRHDERVVVPLDEAARVLGMTLGALQQKVRRGVVPSVKVGGSRRIPTAYLRAIAEGRSWPDVTPHDEISRTAHVEDADAGHAASQTKEDFQ